MACVGSAWKALLGRDDDQALLIQAEETQAAFHTSEDSAYRELKRRATVVSSPR